MRREVVMDVTAQELAGLFVMKGWTYGGIKQIQSDDVATMIGSQVAGLEANPNVRYSELGRFIVFRDQEYPDSFEIAMKVGHVSYYPLDMDSPEQEGTT